MAETPLSERGCYDYIMWRWLANRGGRGPLDPASLGRPWGDRPSIYSHIERSINPSNGRLPSPYTDLPDEPTGDDNRVRFSAGSLDGITRHGFGETNAVDVAQAVNRQLTRTMKERDPKAFNILHGYLLEHSALSYLDDLNPLLVMSVEELGADIATLGRHLLKHAADREVVKFAINLVGVCGGAEDHAALLKIGSHDEFTLFAVVAIGHSGGDVRSTWEMAKRVGGWGRVQCIERLDTEAVDAEISDWLLVEGHKNAVMTEYTAAICARRGGLRAALDAQGVDRRVIDGSAEILAALARGNPGEGMSGYAESALATERFLKLVEQDERPSIHWLLACRDIERFAQHESTEDNGGGWTPEARARCTEATARIRSREVWRRVVARELESAHEFEFNAAAEAAQLIGVDPWENRFRWLVAGGDQWYWLLETRDPQRVDRVLEHAASAIDLKAVATGYGNAMGMGPGFAEHQKLNWILQVLKRWPGRGAAYIDAGLRSPVLRNRWQAAHAALRWDPKTRERFHDAARSLHGVEENAELKAALAKLLAGEIDPARSDGAS